MYLWIRYKNNKYYKQRRIHICFGNEFEKLTRVRVYCNKELCKIGKSYNNGVTIIDSLFDTPKINVKDIKADMKKPKSIQGLFYPLVKEGK